MSGCPQWSAASLALFGLDPFRGPMRALRSSLIEEKQQFGVRLPQKVGGPFLWGGGGVQCCTLFR